MTHEELVQKGSRWLNKEASNIRWRSTFVLVEFKSQGTNEIPDIFGLRPAGHVMIEVKVSRSDFKADALKESRDQSKLQIGNFRFYLVPQGLITKEEIPSTWGLLEWTGKVIQVTKQPQFVESDSKAVEYMYHSVLSRLYDYSPKILDYRKNSKK